MVGPEVCGVAAEFDLNVQLRQLLQAERPRLREIESRLREARDEKVTLEETTMISIELAIERAADRFRERPDDLDLLEEYEELVSLIRDAQIDADMRHPQNEYYLMMSTVRYPSGKKLDMQTQTRLRPFILLLALIGLVILYKEIAVLGICLAYIFFGLFRYLQGRRPPARSANCV